MNLAQRLTAVGVGVILAIGSSTASSVAQTPHVTTTPSTVTTIEIMSDTSTLTLDLDAPLSYEDALEAAESLLPDGVDTASGEQVVLVGTSINDAAPGKQSQSADTLSGDEDIDLDPPITPRPTLQRINCDRSYMFGDSRGQYSLQRKCGVQMALWGYRLSAGMQAICVNGTLRESGMSWAKNSHTMPLGAPHSALPCYYQLHGRYNPAKKGDIVDYRDVINFRHNIGGGGSARLTVSGSFKLLGP